MHDQCCAQNASYACALGSPTRGKQSWAAAYQHNIQVPTAQHADDSRALRTEGLLLQEGSGLQEADVHSVLAGIIADVSTSSAAQESPEAALLGTIGMHLI